MLQTFALLPACPLPPLENCGFEVACTRQAGLEGKNGPAPKGMAGEDADGDTAPFGAVEDFQMRMYERFEEIGQGVINVEHITTGSGVQVAEEALENGQQSATKSDFVKVLPEATEEEWQRRAHKRQEAIQKMQLSPIYYENQHVPAPKRPHTPDVLSRIVSKRDWEGAVAKWRYAWRELDGVSELMNSTGSSEKESLAAWKEAASCIKKLNGENRKLPPEQTCSQELAQWQHKQQALAILGGERGKHQTHFI